MRVIVFSDSHGNSMALRKIVLSNPDADVFLFLGDGERDFFYIRSSFRAKPMYHVQGNCDWGSKAPVTDIYICDRKRIFFTHGHSFNVKSDLYDLEREARNLGANVVLFGHTHLAMTDYVDGLYFMNPGSVSQPRGGKASYGFIDITPAGIVCRVVEL